MDRSATVVTGCLLGAVALVAPLAAAQDVQALAVRLLAVLEAVDGQAGAGTTFTVRVPVAAAAMSRACCVICAPCSASRATSCSEVVTRWRAAP